MIKLPPAFSYSQSSLQDFVDCPRRFQLRYMLEQDWPAPAAEPASDTEQYLEMGRRFHLLLQRHWLGLPIDRDGLDPLLKPWWDAFIANPPADLPGDKRRPEVSVSAVIEGQRMTATFDLLAYQPGGEVVIVDWKTSKRTPRRFLDRRLQTIIYPLMLVECAPRLLGFPVLPEAVRLVYWFAAEPEPGAMEVFQYSAARREEDKRYLNALFTRLLSMDVTDWPLTASDRFCKMCQYRSLCNRGAESGALPDEADTWPDLEEIRGLLAEAAQNSEFVL